LAARAASRDWEIFLLDVSPSRAIHTPRTSWDVRDAANDARIESVTRERGITAGF